MSAPKFLATGRCLPAKIVTNDDLSRTVDTNDEWVFSRTGIHARHFCQEESGMDLAEGAARQALERSGLKPEDIGVCLVATFTPDFASPSMACMLQQRLGLKEDTICFDLNAACAGFLYGTKTAHALLADAPRPYAIVVGAEVISRVLDHTDRNTCVLFGDGAGAAVIAREDSARWHTVFGSRGDSKSIWRARRCSALPLKWWRVPSVSWSRRKGARSTTWTWWSATRPTPGSSTLWPSG